ncbi:MAG: response regulator [Thermodesulfobacteriota bacterium]
MATVLIAEDDLGLQKVLEASLVKYIRDFNTLFAENGEEAVTLLNDQNIDLLVTDIKMPLMDGLALLSHMSVNYPATPCIVLTSYTIPGLEQRLSPSVFRFINKPVDPVYLAGLIKEGLEKARSEEALSGVSIAGFMQIIEAEEKTCLLTVHEYGKQQGVMCFHKGVLHDASCGELIGEAAALQLIGMENSQLKYQKLSPQDHIETNIQKGVQALILEAMRLKDELNETGIDTQEELQHNKQLTEGIQLCKGLHQQKAEQLLLRVASQDTENVQALLWLSRTVTNMKQVHVALSRAHELNKKDKDVNHDVTMFNAASKLGLKTIDHCPFCFAAIGVDSHDCHFCGAVLKINAESLTKIGSNTKQDELRGALDRFKEVLGRELNIPVLFHAALACLHLEECDTTLDYLEQLQQCIGPEEKSYRAAVEDILIYIAARKAVIKTGKDLNAGEESAVAPEVLDKKNILVVDDCKTTRKIIKMILQKHGFDTVEAGDGIEALIKINGVRPDLILLDVMMPKLDGYGLLSALKQNSDLKNIPVIMLSSRSGLTAKLKGHLSSAQVYLTKPIQPDVLLDTINQQLG